MSVCKFIIAIIIFPGLLFTGCSSEKENSNKESIAHVNNFANNEGEKLFNHYCSPCHGKDGKGYGRYYATGLNTRPPDFTDLEFMKSKKDQELTNAIKSMPLSKKEGNLCPLPWGNLFIDTEIKYLVNYIKKFPTSPD